MLQRTAGYVLVDCRCVPIRLSSELINGKVLNVLNYKAVDVGLALTPPLIALLGLP